MNYSNLDEVDNITDKSILAFVTLLNKKRIIGAGTCL